MREDEEVDLEKQYKIDGWNIFDIEEWRSDHWSLYDSQPTLETATDKTKQLYIRYGGQWRIVETQTIKEVVYSLGDEEAILELGGCE